LFHLFAKLPLSAELEEIVVRAVEHAVLEKHDSVGTGGILLAMIRHDQATTAVLRALGIDVADLERVLAKYLHRFMVEEPGQDLRWDADEVAPAPRRANT
jgi:ATP-dependent Clp protease ATP-binding subunit ClpA